MEDLGAKVALKIDMKTKMNSLCPQKYSTAELEWPLYSARQNMYESMLLGFLLSKRKSSWKILKE